jgi:NAD(P)-dependent dehydrogenase (short-subunit alcohol dehydrogenase family)
LADEAQRDPAAAAALPFAGQVALVTGAAGGLGSASARRLAAAGANVIAFDLDADGVNDLVSQLPGKPLAVVGDVSSETDTERLMLEAVRTYGRVDLYHLNAGIPGPLTPLPDLAVSDWDRVIAVNLRSVFLGLRAAFRQYRDQPGEGGAIVITASIASLRGSADLLAYHASKHGVLGAVKSAALYGGPLGIRVNAVAPGIVPTELFAQSRTEVGGGNDMERRAATTPLRRAGTADEIARVVEFLLGDGAAYMTGETVSVDGGAAAVSTVRPSGGAGAWDPAAYDAVLYADTKGPK